MTLFLALVLAIGLFALKAYCVYQYVLWVAAGITIWKVVVGLFLAGWVISPARKD